MYMECSRNHAKAAHYAHYMQRGKTPHFLKPLAPNPRFFRLNIVLRELGDESERWHGQDRTAAQAGDVSGRDQDMEAVETPWKGAPQYLQEQEITADR